MIEEDAEVTFTCSHTLQESFLREAECFTCLKTGRHAYGISYQSGLIGGKGELKTPSGGTEIWRMHEGARGPSLPCFSDSVFWLTGDFAVLLKAGMSVKQAIVYNLLSALMAYVGMMIGIAVGQYTENVTSWIFAITAGMFLYVALVDMVSGPGRGSGITDLGMFPLGTSYPQPLL